MDVTIFGCKEGMIQNYLNSHNCVYTAVIEHSINWTENFSTEADAVNALRELVEADGKHMFIKQMPFKQGYTRYDRDNITSVLKWCDTTTGKVISKRIKVNVKLSDIPEVVTYWKERQKEYEQDLKERYPWKYTEE